jgi:hypothetical protein
MKVYRNTAYIEGREQLGRRLSMGGLIILFIGLLMSFVPTWLPPNEPVEGGIARFLQEYWTIISFGALPLGFLAASAGSYFITRFARRRWPGLTATFRPDELLERSLKGLDDRYSLYLFSLPVGYALVTPSQLITFAVRSDKGTVKVDGDKWRERWQITRILTLFAREGVGNPPTELADQERKMRELLAKAPPGAEGATGAEATPIVQAPIEGAVVFLNSETRLELNEPSVPVLRVDQLKDYVRKRTKEVKPQTVLIRNTNAYLQGVSTGAVEQTATADAAA